MRNIKIEKQTGSKFTRKFKSVSTPGKTFYLIESLAEFCVFQIYGLDVGPKFWYKSANKPKARNTFLKIKNQLFAMIKKQPNIRALDLLGVTLKKYDKPKKKNNMPVKIEIEKVIEEISDEALIELEGNLNTGIFGER